MSPNVARGGFWELCRPAIRPAARCWTHIGPTAYFAAQHAIRFPSPPPFLGSADTLLRSGFVAGGDAGIGWPVLVRVSRPESRLLRDYRHQRGRGHGESPAAAR